MAVPQPPADEPIYCIGDSHASFFSGRDAVQPIWPLRSDDAIPQFRSFHVGPALAYNLVSEGTETRGREKLFEVLAQRVPPGGRVLLVFGEIDCRCHLVKQSQQTGTPIDEVAHACARRFIQAAREVRDRGYRVAVLNAPPNRRIGARRSTKNYNFPGVGTCAQRNDAARRLNAHLQRLCREHDLGFVSTYGQLVTRRGRPDEFYFYDGTHLSQRAMPLTARALRAAFPDFRLDLPDPVRPSLPARLLRLLAGRR